MVLQLCNGFGDETKLQVLSRNVVQINDIYFAIFIVTSWLKQHSIQDVSKLVFLALASIVGTGFSVGSEFASVTSNADTSTALIVYNSSNGGLFYNSHGATPGFGVGGQFAVITGNPGLAATDFKMLV
jgi:hypothetical protein